MSQVKNLRAMFENKGDDVTSPPDRGRSPGGASTPTPMGRAGSTSTESPRPLSRVRTNFVAVEKDGRMGLRRDPASGESSPSRRRLSNDTNNTNTEVTSTLPDRTNSMASSPEDAGTAVAKAQRNLLSPDSAAAASASSSPRPSATTDTGDASGAVSDKPSTNPDKQIDEEESEPSLLPADPTDQTTVPKSTTETSTSKTEKSKAAPSATKTKTSTTTTKLQSTASTSKPPAKPQVRPTAASKAAATAGTAKNTQAKPAARASAHTAGAARSSTATKPTAASASKRPAPLKSTDHHADTGFVKPKPKSPTKPVNLPSSLMAHTASSVSKGGAGLTQSGSAPNLNVPVRSATRAGATTAGTAASKTVRRQGSSIGQPRSSIGHAPAKSVHKDGDKAHRESHVDEGFLARMMRPTQASSSKTHEKPPTTPPRRGAQRPATAASGTSGTSAHRESSTKRPSHTSVPASKETTTAPAHDASSKHVDEAGQETATVESAPQVKKVANEAELSQAAVEPGEPKHGDEQLDVPETVDEVAHETANVETAEEAKDLAKEADLVQTPVEPEASVSELQTESSTKAELAVEEAPAVETAEEANSTAKEVNLAQAPVEPEAANEQKHEDLVVEETAVEAANVETVEEVKEVAEEADLIQTPVEPVQADIHSEAAQAEDVDDHDTQALNVTESEDATMADAVKANTDQDEELTQVEHVSQPDVADAKQTGLEPRAVEQVL